MALWPKCPNSVKDDTEMYRNEAKTPSRFCPQFVQHLKLKGYISSWIFFFFKWKENLGKTETYWGKSCSFRKRKKKTPASVFQENLFSVGLQRSFLKRKGKTCLKCLIIINNCICCGKWPNYVTEKLIRKCGWTWVVCWYLQDVFSGLCVLKKLIN